MTKISPKYFYRPLSAGQTDNSNRNSSSTLPRLSICSSSSSSPNCSTSMMPSNQISTNIVRSTSSTTSPLSARQRPAFQSFGFPPQQQQIHQPISAQYEQQCPHCIIPPPPLPSTSGTYMSLTHPPPINNPVLMMVLPPGVYGNGSSTYFTNSTAIDGSCCPYAPRSLSHSDGGYTETSTYYEQLDDRWQQQQQQLSRTYHTLRPMPARINTKSQIDRRLNNRKAVFTLAVVVSLLVFWLLYLVLCGVFNWPIFSLGQINAPASSGLLSSLTAGQNLGNATVFASDDLVPAFRVKAQPLTTGDATEGKDGQTQIYIQTSTVDSIKFDYVSTSSAITLPITSQSPPALVKLERRLPQAIIIGVKKGGTRALLAYLRMNSKVRTAGPEPHFFDRHYDRGAEWYRNQMPLSAADEITIEKTPSYFITEHAAERVYKLNPHTKILIVLRDPVERAESDYAQSVAKRRATKSFEQMALRLPPPFSSRNFSDKTSKSSAATLQRAYRKARVNTDWNAIKLGIYVHYVRAWLKWFPTQQIHIVSGEGLIYQPAQEIEAVQAFLGLPIEVTERNFYFNATKGFPCIIRPAKHEHVTSDYDNENEDETSVSAEPHCLGNSKGREHPQVHPTVQQKLRDFYSPYNEELAKLTGFHSSWR